MEIIIKILRYLKRTFVGSPPDRYPNLYKTIKESGATKLMEIGTWNGDHGKEMIITAQLRSPKKKISYYGFDLFELMDKDNFEKEYAKIPPSMNEVKEKLSATGANVKLFKGNTNKTLPENYKKLPKMDFIFIDGGHSVDTIKNDWKYSEKLMHKDTVVIFDDYFRNTEDDVKGVGCQYLIDKLDTKTYEAIILEPECYYKKSWGTLRTSMVKVIKKKHN